MSCHRLSSRALREFVNSFRLTRDLTVGPSTAKIFYTARNYLAGKIPGRLVFAVDKWPDYTAVMCASGEGTYKDIETYTFYWENKDGLLKLLRDDKLVDWGKNFTIAAFSKKGLPVLSHVCHEMGKQAPQQDNLVPVYAACHPNVLPASDTGLPDHSVTLGRLEREHAELVNSTWKWGGPPEVLEFIRYVLSTFPSKCVSKQGEPLAFSVLQPWGEIGMIKAMVPGRYATFVVKSMINEIQEAGDLPYGFIEPSNRKVRKISDEDFDVKWDPSGICFYVSL